jgi:hypothetical protein
MVSSVMLRRVALVRTDVLEDLIASIIRVRGIVELGTTLALTSNRQLSSDNSVCFHLLVAPLKVKAVDCSESCVPPFPRTELPWLCSGRIALQRDVQTSDTKVMICCPTTDCTGKVRGRRKLGCRNKQTLSSKLLSSSIYCVFKIYILCTVHMLGRMDVCNQLHRTCPTKRACIECAASLGTLSVYCRLTVQQIKRVRQKSWTLLNRQDLGTQKGLLTHWILLYR